MLIVASYGPLAALPEVDRALARRDLEIDAARLLRPRTAPITPGAIVEIRSLPR